MQSWKTLSKRLILDQGRFLKVETHTVELPDGQVIPDWSWVVTPDFANVVLVTEDERVVCFRQTKYAAEGVTLAPIGGYIEPGEDPLLAAQRETLEETGYEAQAWSKLGCFAVDGNRGAGLAYSYLATGGRRVAERNADDLEEQEMVLLTLDEVQAALLRGEFKVLPWVAALSLALLRLRA